MLYVLSFASGTVAGALVAFMLPTSAQSKISAVSTKIVDSTKSGFSKIFRKTPSN